MDERVRRLERHWATDPDPELGARLLVERVRTGALEGDRLRLAAFLGQPDSVAAAERLGLGVPAEADAEYGRWLRVLAEGWGLRVAVRAAVTVARESLRCGGVDDPRLVALLAALAEWCDDPSPVCFCRVQALHERCLDEPQKSPDPANAAWAAGPTIDAAQAVIENKAFLATSAAREWTWPSRKPRPEGRAHVLRELVRQELIVWALQLLRTSRTAGPGSSSESSPAS